MYNITQEMKNKIQEMEKWIDFNFSKIYQNETYAVYYFDL